jgi:hypothetical protein
MDLNHRNALIVLLTKCEELIAENQALRALLDTVENHGRWQDTTWRAELQHLMESPVREQYRENFAPILREIDSAFQDSELSRLLAKIPTTDRPN